ncbi:diguanylate cyclase [Photobacterium sp. SDRW27]|uniref:sensor domain-containing diguanylate cyclase n=1 Tax=Photobacterium obscurum TaxID=2829490 RepID=UPI002243BD74|nr:sensor domain-containing diguanylate cyclase [Photobacterium obscurum]MCW8328331.1 diguanylate cyclase [Photobacterium obscurum]
MALDEQLKQFYQRIQAQWGKAHGLRTVCELTCRNLCESFAVSHAQLVVAYKSRWKTLLNMDPTGIHYQFPPVDIEDSNRIPFFQINKAIRQQKPHFTANETGMRLWLPLERRSHIIGCLIIDFPDKPQPKSHDFSSLATLLASELDACLLSESIQFEHYGRRSAERELEISQHEQQALKEQLQALHDISFKLWRATSMDNMLFTAVDEAKKVLHIDRMAIFLFKDNYQMQQGTYGTDIHGNTVDEHYFESKIPDQWFSIHTLVQKEYLAIKDGTPLYHDLKQVGFGWSAYISLWDEDTPVGWIACDNLLTGMPLHNYHHQLLKQFGFIVSQHLVRRQAEENLLRLNKELEQRVADRTAELERVNSKLEKISKLDPLTGVSNRRVFDERIIEEWRRAERHQLPISLLIIDVDHFKAYNDTYGHAAGDQCLQQVATTLETLEKRAGALFARYGGEEFVLLLPGQDKRAASYAAKRALHAIQALRLPRTQGADSAPDIVTVSVGVSTIIPSVHSSPATFFKQADIALYEAKSLGRNSYFELP